MQNAFDYIKAEEARYQTMPVPVANGYEWSMYKHVNLTTLYLNSRYETGNQDNLPFRQIILPKIKLQHRAVRIHLSEIEFYINSEDEDYKAFLVRKWHQRWALKNNLPQFLNRLTQTYTSYGGVLLENTPDALEVVPFQRLAFCDQTDMLSGPICQKHQFSPAQLMEMSARGWGDPANGATMSLEELITLAYEEKTTPQVEGNSQKAKTPGRYIEVYDLEGNLPNNFLDPNGQENKFTLQMQIKAFYNSKETGKREGVTLFSGKRAKSRYKAFKRDDDDDSTYGRALGRGGVEELFEPQVWTNYTEIQKKELLDQVSKVLNWTDDPSFKAKNDTNNLENGSTLLVTQGHTFAQVNNSAVNLQAFENATLQWDEGAKEIASARDAISGEASKSGMPFREVALLNQEGHSLHQDRKEQVANFLSSEVYPDWVIPKMIKDVSGGAEFLDTLSLEEMGEIVDQVVNSHFNKTIIDKVLKPLPNTKDFDKILAFLEETTVHPEAAQALKDTYRQQFFKSNRKFLKILEGELKDLPIEMETNITGEQKNRQMMDEKTAQIWTQATQVLMANPNFFTEHPEMGKFFNDIIKASGFPALNFGQKGIIPQLTQPNAQQNAKPQVQGQPQAA